MTAPTEETVDPTTLPVGSVTGSHADAKPEDDLYVPVTNINYIPEGAPKRLEGFVPGHPGNDSTLIRIAEALETQGFVAGPIDSDTGIDDDDPDTVAPTEDQPELTPEDPESNPTPSTTYPE